MSRSRKPASARSAKARSSRRWSLLRRHARELARPGDRAFEIEPERAHGRYQREAGEEIEPGGKASGIGFDPADGTRAEEAAEIADAVDPGDAGRRRTAGQDH